MTGSRTNDVATKMTFGHLHASFVTLVLKKIRIATRLIAALPPLAAAYGMRSLSNIVDFAGILGFIIMFVTPAALYYKSSVACEQWWGSSGAVTVYFTRGVSTKGDGVVIVVVVVVVVAVAVVVG